tara:strand:- start:2735 stop:3058 length:324 start_codon:yes stop_codon:yes gene_type:complete
MTEEKTHGKEIGKVIWFDHKKGYGFIHIISDTENSNKDVFCHYSSIQSDSSYKKLIPGECVSLDVNHDTDKKEHQYSSMNVTGVLGSELLCENQKYKYKVYPLRIDA